MDGIVFEQPTWAIVELMGRQVIAGEVREVTVAGAAMLRVDVPAIWEKGAEVLPAYTKFYGASALYGITPTDEASARHAVEHLRARPISVYEIPLRVLSQSRLIERRDEDDDEERPF